jgi:hypothetical protein
VSRSRREQRRAEDLRRRRQEALAQVDEPTPAPPAGPPTPATGQPQSAARRTMRPPGADPGPHLPPAPVPAWQHTATAQGDADDVDGDDFDDEAADVGLRPPAKPLPRLIAALTVTVLGFAFAYGSGAPVQGHTWNWIYLGAGAAVTLIFGYLAYRASRTVTFRTKVISYAVAVLFTAAFVTGAHTSVVVGDKTYLATSATARAYVLSNELYADLKYIADADPMLAAEQADARARFAEYKPAAEKLAEMSKKWAKVASEPENLPSPAFAEVAAKTANAAHWQSESMALKATLIVEADARGEQQLASYRATYYEQVLLSWELLQPAAKLYGIELAGPQE